MFSKNIDDVFNLGTNILLSTLNKTLVLSSEAIIFMSPSNAVNICRILGKCQSQPMCPFFWHARKKPTSYVLHGGS